MSRNYPWSTIGRVQGTAADAQSYHCTGTLISSDIVLTNAHCVIDSETHQLSKELWKAIAHKAHKTSKIKIE
ncbi:trypsin-like serine peptidase [Nostoc sp.]|uniref:trypsin-like serine peptidase n=1 Tax=Nostoc sp. TaxID=1180 RepID=UPI002FF8B9E3